MASLSSLPESCNRPRSWRIVCRQYEAQGEPPL